MRHLNVLWENLINLGGRRLAALSLIFLLIFGVVGFGAYYLSRPNFEILYSGLDREDVSRIGAVLKTASIPFDINPEGNTVSVQFGQSAQARMLLAERGLPQSANVGYELFDKVGALGLTSFMQEVTRVRALEGELARTIQLIRGVKAARVHLVMPDEGTFRRAKQAPSASVVIRTEGPDDARSAQAIRHLVAASLPGMTVDQVTVLNTDGVILTTTDGDIEDAIPAKTLSMEKAISKDIQDNIRRTLAPYLRLPNFQVTVRTRINTDRKQVNETIYDPDSRVERSVRTVKENSASQNNSASSALSAERNIPQSQQAPGDGKQSSDENRKSEELTNFELSSKSTATVSGGYAIEGLAIAVIVNRSAFAAPNKEIPKPDVIEQRMREIEQLVISASGLKKERGDTLKVTAVDFMFDEHEMSPVEGQGTFDILSGHLGSIISAGTFLAISILMVIFGLRPATRALLIENPRAEAGPPPLLTNNLSQDRSGPQPESLPAPSSPDLSANSGARKIEAARRGLEELINSDETHAAALLKQWMRSEDAA
jgi:flagellar M-ring protein FliF